MRRQPLSLSLEALGLQIAFTVSIGCSIYFAPVDRSWIGTPTFIRGVAVLFGVERVKWLWISQGTDFRLGEESDWDHTAQTVLERCDQSIDSAILAQRAGDGYTTTMHLSYLGTSWGPLTKAVLNNLPEELSEGWVPVEAAIHNGRWEVYDYGGDWIDGGACCVELKGGDATYPVAKQEYLEAFLKVPAVVQFQGRLEEISSQAWSAIIELT